MVMPDSPDPAEVSDLDSTGVVADADRPVGDDDDEISVPLDVPIETPVDDALDQQRVVPLDDEAHDAV